MFSLFKKKKIIPHVKLNGVIGNVGKFKQGIDFAGQEDLLKKAGVNFILKYNELEGDDIIAISKKFIENNKNKKDIIYIITNDQDYLQLINETTLIFNLKFKELNSTKKSFKDPKKDLLCKIIIGDKSDNIPPVFQKCGIKTVEKYLNDNELLQNDLDKYNVREKFNFNKKIIDFDEIPHELSSSFLESNIESYKYL